MYSNNTNYQNELAQYVKNLPVLNSYSGKTVIVTGCCGLIGTYIVDLLMKKNEIDNAKIRVIGIDFSLERETERFSEYHSSPYYRFILHNVNLPLEYIGEDADYIIHAASNTSPINYGQKPVETISANVIGTYMLLEYAKTYNIKRFLFCSSVEIYGQNRGDIEDFNEAYSGYIDCNTARACYPAGKRAAEAMCASYYSEYNVEYVTARIGRYFGPTVIMGDTKAPTQFIMNGLNKENIIMKSSGTQMFSWGYVGDCAAGLLFMLIKGKAGEVYNIADPTSKAMLKEFSGCVSEAAGTKLEFIEQNSKELAGYSKITKATLDVSKLESLGYKSTYNYKEGIKKTLEYLSSQK